jgi:hypothetical protein
MGPCYGLVFAKSRESEMASLRTADPRRNVCLLGKIGSERYRVEVTRMPSRPGEFHPEPLTDPDLILSHHPARAID